MIYGKIQIQKNKKIHKSTKNVRNPHILPTLPNLHFFGLFKIFWNIIWLGYCLNRFVTLRKWWNDFWKNPNPKIWKISQEYEECEESSHSSYPPNSSLFGLFKIFWDIIWLAYFWNRFVTLRKWWNDFRKNSNPKILKN